MEALRKLQAAVVPGIFAGESRARAAGLRGPRPMMIKIHSRTGAKPVFGLIREKEEENDQERAAAAQIEPPRPPLPPVSFSASLPPTQYERKLIRKPCSYNTETS